MKVVGLGAPRTLEMRLKCCELVVWRDVLREAHAEELGADGHDATRADPGVRLAQLSRLMREAYAPWRADQPVQVVGPTSLLAPLVRTAANKAIDRYVTAATGFLCDAASVESDHVRAALDTTSAWTATLLALHRVEHDRGVPVDARPVGAGRP